MIIIIYIFSNIFQHAVAFDAHRNAVLSRSLSLSLLCPLSIGTLK